MSIASRVLALCLLGATPLTATLVTLTFNEYCDQLSGYCGTPTDVYRYPIVGTTTVNFDDAITRQTAIGPLEFLSFGTPDIDSSLTDSLPFPIPVDNAMASVILQNPLRIFPGAAVSLRIQAGSVSLDDVDSILHQISFTASGFDLRVGPADTDYLSVPFSFSESEFASVNVEGHWATIVSQYAGIAYLVSVQTMQPLVTGVAETPEPATCGLIAAGLLFVLRRR